MPARTTEIAGTTPLVALSGTDAPADWYDQLLELRVERELRLPGRAVLRFSDPEYALTGDSRLGLGKPVKISAQARSASPVVLLDGHVTGMSTESSIESNELVIVVHDRAQSLARGTVVDSYLQRTASDVVQEIAKRHGLQAKVQSTRVVMEYLLQVDTDLAMLDALADRTGFDWWVEGETLQFRAPGRQGGARKVAMGDDLTRFDVRASGLRPDDVAYAGYDRGKQLVVTERTKTAASAGVVNGPSLLAPYASPGKVLGNRARVLVGSDETVRSRAEAEDRAGALRDRLGAGAVTATAVLRDAPDVGPGTDLDVHGVGPVSGTYHVTRVEHRYRQYFETVATAGERRPTSLVDTLPRTAGPGAGAPLVVGTVTAVGKPTDPEGGGRVKVRFEGLARSGAEKDQESHWARVLTLGAGKDRGLIVLPEVGDEVLVAFERGDVRQPVVLGGLFGDKQKTAMYDVNGQGAVSTRRLVSRTGHKVELAEGDGPADQHVLVQLAGAKTRLRLGEDACDLTVPAGTALSIKVGDSSSLVFDGKGKVTLKALDVLVDATKSFEVKTAQATVKASTTLLLEGTTKADLKGAMVAVQASGIATLKGSMVQIN